MFSLRITGWWSLVWGLLSTRLHNTFSLNKNKKLVQSKLTNPNHNPPSSRNAPTSRNSAKARHYSTCTIFMVTSPWQRATFDERNNKKKKAKHIQGDSTNSGDCLSWRISTSSSSSSFAWILFSHHCWLNYTVEYYWHTVEYILEGRGRGGWLDNCESCIDIAQHPEVNYVQFRLDND